MSYTVQSTEKLKKSGSDGETKALLYLMNFHKDSNEIYYFIVDFFNDLTGMDSYSTKLWDIQSKAAKNNSPKSIGKELVTLFKNFLSDFDFAHFILFLGGVTGALRIDDTVNTFSIDNINASAKTNIISGLKEEATKKTYIENSLITDTNINNFLEKIVFVIDDKLPGDYVRAIIKNHPSIIPNDDVLNAIFNEIRNKQSEKKNINVEGITIQTTDEAICYCKHLTSSEIRLLTLQRIINRNPVEQGIPAPFISIYNKFPFERQKETVDNCKQALCRALFNKNVADSFWRLFECVYTLIIKYPDLDVRELFLKIDSDIKQSNPDFDVLSLEYFIAIIKEGVEGEN